MSLSNYLEEKFLNHLRGTSYTAPSGLYLKLHLGDPGEDCTANAAATTTRVAATFAAAVNPGGTMTAAGPVTWASVANAENVTHFSVWDTVGPTGGNPLGSGPLSSAANLAVGDTLNVTNIVWSLD